LESLNFVVVRGFSCTPNLDAVSPDGGINEVLYDMILVRMSSLEDLPRRE